MREQTSLVIGGNGFVGQHMVARLKERGWPVEFTSRHAPDGATEAWHLELANCVNGVPCWLRKFDVIYNCAAIVGFANCETYSTAYRVNVDAPMAIALQLQPHQVFVHLSSDAVEFAFNTALGFQKAMSEVALLATRNCVVVRLKRLTEATVVDACDRIIAASKLKPPALVIAYP